MLEISLQELAAALEKTDVLQGYADTRDGRIILMGEDESDAQTEAASREEERMERLLSIEEDWAAARHLQCRDSLHHAGFCRKGAAGGACCP